MEVIAGYAADRYLKANLKKYEIRIVEIMKLNYVYVNRSWSGGGTNILGE